MIIQILFKYIIGYIRVSLEGYFVERFINICRNCKILIWNIKKIDGIKVELNVGIKDFKELIKIAKKTQCKIKIKAKSGLPFIFHKYRRRKIFICLLLIIFLLIGFSTRFIWNIEIIVQDCENLENIEEDLYNSGLIVGKKKKDIDTNVIINQIRLKRNDISWIGININGTNAVVKIVKADKAPEIIDENDYCNIVARKSGVIQKIVAQNGTIKVKEGDLVRQGDILIEGVMIGKYTEKRYVHSIGEIKAKVWYTESMKISYNINKKVETGNKEKKYSIKINKFKINFYKKLSNFKIYDTIENEKKLKIFSNIYLPFSVVEKINKEQKIEEKKYSIEEAKSLGIKQLEEKLNDQIINKENILR